MFVIEKKMQKAYEWFCSCLHSIKQFSQLNTIKNFIYNIKMDSTQILIL